MSSHYPFVLSCCCKTLLIAFLLVFFSGTRPAISASYYVAVNGSNTNTGTLSSPWKTITKAANTLVAGDVVNIGPGTYRERLIPQNSGSNGNYITFKAQQGAVVVIDGTTIALPAYESGLVQIEGKNYIKISGLQVQNAGPNINNAGIYIENSNNIVIEKNSIYNTVSSGIGVWGSTNIIIDSNEVKLACNDGEQECITVASTSNFEIKNNHVHHSGPGTLGGEGIDAKDGASNGKIFGNIVNNINRLGIYIEAWDKHTYDVEVYQNKIYNCLDDGIALASEMGGLLEDISIFNNVITNNRYNGISITPNGDVARPPMRNLSVINNTIYNNGDSSLANPWGGGISVDNPNIDTLVIRNNILSTNLLYQILIDVSVKELSVDHNLIDGFRGYTNEIKGSASVSGNPNFVNTATDDYHIGSDSPAIDNGSPVGAPSVDFDLLKRPQGAGYDMGAFEYSQQSIKGVPGMLILFL